MSKIFRRTIAAGLAACMLLAGSVTAAEATRGRGYEEQEHPAGRFYGNFELGILLFTGGGVEEICNDAPEPVVLARVFERNDGTVVLRAYTREMPFVLYYSELGAPEFIDQTCQALFDDDPETMPVQPFASGTGRFRERIVTTPDGVEDHFNAVSGRATGPDGTTWKVRTWADFIIDNGVLIGDPAEFQGLSIRQVGR
ncbi:MAG: hypothetical protein OEV40_21530 [Acidimicrobiia bacterium]|nr:hypothetical protein [Acidimicrobiia bacterium]